MKTYEVEIESGDSRWATVHHVYGDAPIVSSNEEVSRS
jgi:hypothetical protein